MCEHGFAKFLVACTDLHATFKEACIYWMQLCGKDSSQQWRSWSYSWLTMLLWKLTLSHSTLVCISNNDVSEKAFANYQTACEDSGLVEGDWVWAYRFCWCAYFNFCKCIKVDNNYLSIGLVIVQKTKLLNVPSICEDVIRKLYSVAVFQAYNSDKKTIMRQFGFTKFYQTLDRLKQQKMIVNSSINSP